ncbi:MAG: hemerythrin domain-containing protein [Chloroflexi bacterium]|nr:hemerythrin domain-containing protein [Chloroflexota bacterium]
MVTPLDVIPSFHQAFRNDMKIIDDSAYKAAAEGGDLAPTIERLRFFSEILKWHADGEDELVFPAMDKVAPLVAQGYLHDHHEFDTMTEGLAKITAASSPLVAARETAALTAVLRIHLDKEDQYLYPILKERTSLEEQTAIVGGMAAHVPPDRNPEFIRWLFGLLGHDDREMWTRVVMGLMPEQVFAHVKVLIRETITDDWAELTRRIPELAS